MYAVSSVEIVNCNSTFSDIMGAVPENKEKKTIFRKRHLKQQKPGAQQCRNIDITNTSLSICQNSWVLEHIWLYTLCIQLPKYESQMAPQKKNQDLLSCNYELLLYNYELISHYYEIIIQLCGFKLSHNYDIIIL